MGYVREGIYKLLQLSKQESLTLVVPTSLYHSCIYTISRVVYTLLVVHTLSIGKLYLQPFYIHI